MAVQIDPLRSSDLSRRPTLGGRPATCCLPVPWSEATSEPPDRTNERKRSAVISDASTVGILIKNDCSSQQCTFRTKATPSTTARVHLPVRIFA